MDIQFNDVMIQLGLHNAVKGNIFNMDNKKCEELYLRASSTIHMSLAKNILANVLFRSSSKDNWEILEGICQTKSISNDLC